MGINSTIANKVKQRSTSYFHTYSLIKKPEEKNKNKYKKQDLKNE